MIKCKHIYSHGKIFHNLMVNKADYKIVYIEETPFFSPLSLILSPAYTYYV